ncbi:MAG TPA: enoyl-ACP reductase FabV [Vicinamibacterales bacterium]|jgi:enoyl-[acyl-carrier protein] reductase/trans-2-enoyl-CoA reductase (NAD+)|nr:enoyl-ACP reductase FabV [Vicinamibacterales bacterium]
MIITPRVRGFICTTAHPIGCARLVRDQVDWVRSQPRIAASTSPNVLVVGGSGGYGLASRSVAAFALRAKTLCLSFEKAPTAETTATAGWYNNHAFDRIAASDGLYARTVNADAFADETKTQIADLVRRDLGGIDLLIYSLASPVRRDPDSGTLFRSAIKPVGQPVHIKTLNVAKGVVHDVDLAPASEDEIHATVKVMGGEDWERWVTHLQREGLLRPGFRTLAYTYIGSALTWPIYWDGTLGKAKADLDRAAAELRRSLVPLGGDARVAVLKAVVTQASAAIPAIPLYASLLFKVMKERGVHEDCVQQIHRLFRAHLADGATSPTLDDAGRIRMDDWELDDAVQAEVRRRWDVVATDSVMDLSDLTGFRRDFLRIFGFEAAGVDYGADISPLD